MLSQLPRYNEADPIYLHYYLGIQRATRILLIASTEIQQNLQIFANVESEKGMNVNKSKWNYPTKDKTQFSSSDTISEQDYEAQLIILPTEFDKFCTRNCVLLISVLNTNKTIGEDNKQIILNMLATQTLRFYLIKKLIFIKRTLDSGFPIKDYIQERSYKYYEINVKCQLNKICNLWVSVNAIGKVQYFTILANIQSEQIQLILLNLLRLQINYPTIIDNQYSVNSNEGDLIVTNAINKKYYIGIYSEQTAQILVIASYGSNNIRKVQNNVPGEVFIQPSYNTYLEFSHNLQNESLKLFFAKEYSQFIAYIKPVDINKISEKDEFELPDENNYVWSSLESQNYSLIYIDSNDKNYCFDCLYYIYLKPKKGAANVVVLSYIIGTETNKIYLNSGILIMNNIKQDDLNLYTIPLHEQNKKKIEINVLSGQIKLKMVGTYTENDVIKIDETLQPFPTDTPNHLFFYYTPPKQYSLFWAEIDGIQDSIYTIRSNDDNQTEYLTYGIAQREIVQPQATQNYTFTYNKIFSDSQMYLQIALMDCNTSFKQGLRNTQTNCSFPEIAMSYKDLTKQSVHEVPSNSFQKTTNFVIIVCPKSNAVYDIQVKNSNTTAMTYEILQINSQDSVKVNSFTDESQIFGIIENTNSQIIEFFHPKLLNESYYLISEFQVCAGQIDVTIAEDYSNLYNGEQQSNHYLTNNYKQSKHLVGDYQLNFNPIYLEVKSDKPELLESKLHEYYPMTKSLINPVSIFFTQFQFLSKDKILGYDFMFPGKEGEITYQNNDDEIILKFSGIQVSQQYQSYYQTQHHVYELFSFDDLQILQYGVNCAFDSEQFGYLGTVSFYVNNEGQILQPDITSTKELQFQIKKDKLYEMFGDKKKKTLYSNIRALITGQFEDGSSNTMTYYYNYEEFDLDKKKSKLIEIIFISCISVFVVAAIIFGIFMWRRHKVVKRLITFEEQNQNIEIGLERIDSKNNVTNEPILTGYQNERKTTAMNYSQFQDENLI